MLSPGHLSQASIKLADLARTLSDWFCWNWLKLSACSASNYSFQLRSVQILGQEACTFILILGNCCSRFWPSTLITDESYSNTGLQAPLPLAQNFLVPKFESIEWNFPGCVSLQATKESAESYQLSGWQTHDSKGPHASDCTVESSPALNSFLCESFWEVCSRWWLLIVVFWCKIGWHCMASLLPSAYKDSQTDFFEWTLVWKGIAFVFLWSAAADSIYASSAFFLCYNIQLHQSWTGNSPGSWKMHG